MRYLCPGLLPDGRTGKLPRLPLRLDGSALPLRRHPPPIGNGTRELLRTIGLDDVEIESLLSDQIVPA